MRTCLYVVAVAATVLGCGASSDAATSARGAEMNEGRDAGVSAGDGEAPIVPPGDAGDGGAPADAGAQKILSPIPRAFADPFVLHAGAYHLYATNDRGTVGALAVGTPFFLHFTSLPRAGSFTQERCHVRPLAT